MKYFATKPLLLDEKFCDEGLTLNYFKTTLFKRRSMVFFIKILQLEKQLLLRHIQYFVCFLLNGVAHNFQSIRSYHIDTRTCPPYCPIKISFYVEYVKNYLFNAVFTKNIILYNSNTKQKNNCE